jgi:hypothetical protein
MIPAGRATVETPTPVGALTFGVCSGILDR